MNDRSIQTVGILGAGRVGTAIARQALRAGYEVLVATSRPASEISLLVEIMAPEARAVGAEEAARASDLVVLAVPLPRYRTLRPELLSGQVVIDVMNYWPATDGEIAEFAEAVSSEVVQEFLPGARLVRTLNHLGYHDIEDDAMPPGHPQRRALAVAGNDAGARAVVAAFIDRLGFDPVDAGPLSAAAKLAPGTRIFGRRLQRDELERELSVDMARNTRRGPVPWNLGAGIHAGKAETR